MIDYSYVKFGDCSFSRFGSIVQTDKHRQTRMNALLPRLSSVWVIKPTGSYTAAVFCCVLVPQVVRLSKNADSETGYLLHLIQAQTFIIIILLLLS